jgi:prevent-host-death family protein
MKVLQQFSMSELRTVQADIFNNLKEQPIIITRQGKPAGVLVDPEKWNALLEKLEDLEDNVDGLTAELALARGEDEIEDFVPTAVKNGATSSSY